jgi:hypothetical protein
MGGPKKTLALQYAKQWRCQLRVIPSSKRNLLEKTHFWNGAGAGAIVRGDALPIYCAVQRKQRHHPGPAA